MLEQIISNAIKYSDAKRNKKYVVFSIEKINETTKLTIKDEGVGIPEQDLPRVFEPFFTGENGRKFRNSTGIGLYLCKQIIERNDGRLIASSEGKNKGGTFTIVFPIIE